MHDRSTHYLHSERVLAGKHKHSRSGGESPQQKTKGGDVFLCGSDIVDTLWEEKVEHAIGNEGEDNAAAEMENLLLWWRAKNSGMHWEGRGGLGGIFTPKACLLTLIKKLPKTSPPVSLGKYTVLPHLALIPTHTSNNYYFNNMQMTMYS